jgi:hypothetical protein
MIKVKQILITLAVFWLVCYATMFLLIGAIFLPSTPVAGKRSSQPMVGPSNAVVMVAGSTNALASVPAARQSELADLFARPILPASLETVFAGLALIFGYQFFRFFGSFRYRN